MEIQTQTMTPTKIAQPTALLAREESRSAEAQPQKDTVVISSGNDTGGPGVAEAESTFLSKAGKTALVATGIAAGAALAYAGAWAALNGTFWLHSALFKYVVPKSCPDPQIAAGHYIQAIQRGMQMAPAAGALAGGIITGLAMRSDEESKRIQEHPGITIKGRFQVALHNFQDTMRETGDSLKAGAKGVKEAESFGEAVSAGGGAGYNVGSTIGRIGGFVEGAYQGSALLTIMAGAPWAYPAMSVPLSIIGALGMGMALGEFGNLAGGITGSIVGGTTGGIAYGVKKLHNAISGKHE
jgi:hypothetical protein